MANAAQKAEVLNRVKTIMRRDLKLGPDIVIEDDMPFFGGSADIDSLDVLLLLGSVEREFGIKISSEEMGRKVFQNVSTLSDYVCDHLNNGAAAATAARPAAAGADGDLLAQLPHQPPFRFVSRLDKIEPDKEAWGVWTISGQEAFFEGHFPGRPIVPGVLIAEALAQLSGLAKHLRSGAGRLAQVEIRFDGAVVPPAEIQLHARVARSGGSLVNYEVEAVCRGAVVARGTLSLNWPGAA
jgi:3-hydroxymyristoyl/3-hydroxydecanoyl-(acyl carrier protein) dehydratase/acyl carrier protein